MADARGQAGADAGAGSGGGLVPAELKHAALNRSAAFVPRACRRAQHERFRAIARGPVGRGRCRISGSALFAMVVVRGAPAYWARGAAAAALAGRSEERRVGKEWVRKCRSRWAPVLSKK